VAFSKPLTLNDAIFKSIWLRVLRKDEK